MFAIVRTGGKQYRVAAGDKIVVDKIDGEAGASIALDVLLAGEGSELRDAAGVNVAAEVIAQAKGELVEALGPWPHWPCPKSGTDRHRHNWVFLRFFTVDKGLTIASVLPFIIIVHGFHEK